MGKRGKLVLRVRQSPPFWSSRAPVSLKNEIALVLLVSMPSVMLGWNEIVTDLGRSPVAAIVCFQASPHSLLWTVNLELSVLFIAMTMETKTVGVILRQS